MRMRVCEFRPVCTTTIDVLSYWTWRCITSFIDHAIQIYVGQKHNANQWKVTVLEEFLHAVLLYQSITVRIINVLAVLKLYSGLVGKG